MKWIYAVGTYLSTGPRWLVCAISVTQWAIMRPRNPTPPVRGEGTFRASQVEEEMRISSPLPPHSLNHSRSVVQNEWVQDAIIVYSEWERERKRVPSASLSLFSGFPPLAPFPARSLPSRFLFNLRSPRPWRFDRSPWSCLPSIPKMIFADQSWPIWVITLRNVLCYEIILQYQIAIISIKKIMVVLGLTFLRYDRIIFTFQLQ